jgi:hypothetical protein
VPTRGLHRHEEDLECLKSGNKRSCEKQEAHT